MASVRVELEKETWKEIATQAAYVNHNIGAFQVAYVIAESLPSGFDLDTATMKNTIRGDHKCFTELGANKKIYAYSIYGDAELSVTTFEAIVPFLTNMVTDPGLPTSRFKVDAQPTSFEENTEFKIFYRIQSLSQNNQLVIKFTTVNALNIMVRKINLWEGGREYLVYGDDGSHTVTGTFTDIDVFNVNGNVEGGGSHPTSLVNASVAIGSGIFTAGSLPSNGDGVLTDSNANRANNQPLSDNNQSGVASGSTFYLVFNHIGQNSNTKGQFFLQWEERF